MRDRTWILWVLLAMVLCSSFGIWMEDLRRKPCADRTRALELRVQRLEASVERMRGVVLDAGGGR